MPTLFMCSVLFSLDSISRSATNLHFYGEEPTKSEHLAVALLLKFPQATSQLLGLIFFALLKRPVGHKSPEEEIQTTRGILIAPCITVRVAIN